MPTLAAVVTDLQQQWELLRAWLEELPDPASPEPSTLPGWSIGDLVAHLGRNLDAIAVLQPVELEGDDEPQSLSAYLDSYRTVDPERIDAVTHKLAAEIADDPLGRIDERAEAALAHLRTLSEAGDDAVVIARRGAITLVDFGVSRLIELVVHAYDLAPALPLPVPVDPTARTIVAQALLDVARFRTGEAIDVGDETAWVLAASGRIDWPTAVARGAVRPSAASDGLPDLTASLPLL